LRRVLRGEFDEVSERISAKGHSRNYASAGTRS
jgi:hypothetical protein